MQQNVCIFHHLATVRSCDWHLSSCETGTFVSRIASVPSESCYSPCSLRTFQPQHHNLMAHKMAKFLTHWPLGDITVILKMQFSDIFSELKFEYALNKLQWTPKDLMNSSGSSDNIWQYSSESTSGFYTKGRPLVKSNLICPSDKFSWQPDCPVLNIDIQGNFCIRPGNDPSDNLPENLV